MEFAVSQQRWSLRLLGVWPIRDSFSDVRLVITLLLIASIAIPQLTDLLQVNGFSKNMIKNLSTLIPFTLVTIKLIMIRVHMRRLRECLHGMMEDWSLDWKPEFKEEFIGIMMRNAKIGRTFNIVCNVLLYVTAVGFLTLPFTVPDPGIEINEGNNSTQSNFSHVKLPVSAVYFFDAYRSPIFELTYTAQCLGIMTGATSNFSTDSFLPLLVLHICGQLEILGKTLEHYRGVNEHSESTQIYTGCCSCLTCIVERHLRIARFSQMLEKSFRIVLLANLFGNTMLFCFLGYQVIMNVEESEAIGIATFLLYMLTMMFHLFLYSYVGEQIMEKSKAIGDCAYKASWYNLEPTAAKPLILLMARSKTPLRITAGKFIIMSLENYTGILKTSATYLSFLRAVRE